jgi:hypothetical protein
MKVRPLALAAMLAMLSGCSARQVEVRTASPKPSTVSVEVKNTVNQAVNVYVTLNGNDTFLRQVDANSSVTIPVQGFAAGSTVGLKAVTIDGARTYSRANVVLNGTYVFPLP